MATEKERSLTNEILALAMDVNDAGAIDVHVDVTYMSVQIRMSSKPFDVTNDWVYYPDRAAYFSGGVFTEENFEYVAGEYILELKKHHPQYDADGVRV